MKTDEPQLSFDPGAHVYTLDGVVVPSVTQITDCLNDDAYASVPPAVMQTAAERGTAVHKACELFDRGTLDWSSLDGEVARYLDCWSQFIDETGFEIEFNEHQTFHKKLRYAGTVDRIGRFHSLAGVHPKKRVELDIKTTAAWMPSFGPQGWAYAEAFNSHRVKAEHATDHAVVRLTPQKRTPFEVRFYRDRADWSCFQSLLNVRNWRTKNG